MSATTCCRFLPWGVVGCLCAGLAGVLAVALVQAPRELSLDGLDPFHFNAEASGPREIPVGQPLELPQTYGDFDLIGEVELSSGGELDIAVRRVEPRYEGLQFHGRFLLLRLSAVGEGGSGDPYASSAQALFGGETGAVRLAPGIPATVQLRARGHVLYGNVAGQVLPPVETVDDHGSLVFVSRGGKALLRRLEILPVAPAWGWAWLLAPLITLVVPVVTRGGSPLSLASLLVIPFGAWVSSWLIVGNMLPLTSPGEWSELLLALWLLPASMALAARRVRVRFVLAGLLAGVLALEVASRFEASRLALSEDPRLSLYFGEQSGSAPLDAFTGRMNSVTGMHLEASTDRRVFFMGGRLLYEPLLREQLFQAGLDDRDILASLTTSALRESLGEDVVGVVVPTLSANALQQLLLFRAFYLDFAPRVVVFAVTRGELGESETGNVRRQLEQAEVEPAVPVVFLGELLGSSRTEPVATPGELRQTLDELAELCKERGIALVLWAEADLPDSHLDVVRSAAAARTVPLAILNPWDEGLTRAEKLRDLILPALR